MLVGVVLEVVLVGVVLEVVLVGEVLEVVLAGVVVVVGVAARARLESAKMEMDRAPTTASAATSARMVGNRVRAADPVIAPPFVTARNTERTEPDRAQGPSAASFARCRRVTSLSLRSYRPERPPS